ncbi:MAG: hypothetical protein M0Z58_07270 [Nitrospiraceae bacterium]|nr:hypothetical protein [Nitrospiraceae bacterium]
MKVKRGRRTEACIAVETACADIYRRLSERFPGAGSLWSRLSVEEEDHKVWLKTAAGGPEDELDELQVDFFERRPMPFINEALECARELKKRLEADDLTLEDALRMSLDLEKNTVEGYFWDVLTGETDSETVAGLKLLIDKEKSHGERLIALMSERGIAHKNFRPEIPAD